MRVVITTHVDANVGVNLKSVNGTPSEKDVIVSNDSPQEVNIPLT